VALAGPIDLKASDNFALTTSWSTRLQIQYARRYYNGAVNLLNNRIQRFPDLLIANTLASSWRSSSIGGPGGGKTRVALG
jgi:hypothetical protein